jgi:uncharacterized protein (TIGR03437 family)
MILLACAPSAAAADYVTYIGDAYTYHVTAIATDSSGGTYVTGSRVIVPQASPLTDIFVSRLDALGNVTLLATLSGKAADQANGIAVDPSGNIYVVGATTSPDFPLHHPLQATLQGGRAGFLVKLAADGTVLYSTYLGGTAGSSRLNAVVGDAQGNAYVTGETFAPDYPHTAGLPASAASPGVGAVSAAFFAKVSPTGDRILYAGGLGATTRACGCCSGCFTSTLSNTGTAIAVDSAGDAYITGTTGGTGLATTPAALRTDGIGAFVAKVNASGTGLAYVTLLGSANYIPGGTGSNPGNRAYAIAVDSAGDAYIAGSTSDPNFPATASAFQPALSLANPPIDPFVEPPADAFVAKLNPTGSAMVWATFLGGTGADQANAIAIDPAGNVWVSGTTQSADFPGSGGFPAGSEFLVAFHPSGSSLSYGSRFPSDTVGAALAIDPSGLVHTAGSTGVVSTLTPGEGTSARLFGAANAAGGDLGGRVAPGELISIYGLDLGPSTPVSATFDTAGFLPTTVAGLQVTINGSPAPLLFVSDTQINAVAPIELVNPVAASLRLTINGSPLPDFRLVVDTAIPKIFRHRDGSTAAINQDGTANSSTNPAKIGSVVSLWVTGAGWTSGLTDGQRQTTAQPGCVCIVHDISQGKDIIPSYAGAAPGMVNGIMQINFQVAGQGHYYSLTGTGDLFSIFVTP